MIDTWIVIELCVMLGYHAIVENVEHDTTLFAAGARRAVLRCMLHYLFVPHETHVQSSIRLISYDRMTHIMSRQKEGHQSCPTLHVSQPPSPPA